MLHASMKHEDIIGLSSLITSKGFHDVISTYAAYIKCDFYNDREIICRLACMIQTFFFQDAQAKQNATGNSFVLK